MADFVQNTNVKSAVRSVYRLCIDRLRQVIWWSEKRVSPFSSCRRESDQLRNDINEKIAGAHPPRWAFISATFRSGWW
jgi:hypothetical protein